MAFFIINTNATGARDLRSLISYLVNGQDTAEKLATMIGNMSDAQVQSYFGFTGTKSDLQTTINGVVTALDVAAVDNLTGKVG